ncbi:MAG: hypothetical protein MJZ03_04330 [archaeon]|nr:hypothetical protein [archaeon]
MDYKKIEDLNIGDCLDGLSIKRSSVKSVVTSHDNISAIRLSLTGVCQTIDSDEVTRLIINRLSILLYDDKKAYLSCKSKEEYQYYLTSWSDGFWCEEAKKAIDGIDKTENERIFFENNKYGIAGLETYMERYPKGIYVNTAMQLLADLRRKKKIKNFCIGALLLIGTISVLFIFGTGNAKEDYEIVEDDSTENSEDIVECEYSVENDEESEIAEEEVEIWCDCEEGTSCYIDMPSGMYLYFPSEIADCALTKSDKIIICNHNNSIRIETSCDTQFETLSDAYVYRCSIAENYDMTYKRNAESFVVVSWWNGDIGNYYRAEMHYGVLHEWHMIWNREDHYLAKPILDGFKIKFGN